MISVTSYIEDLRKPINWDLKAKKLAKEQGIDVESIKQEWKEEREKGLMKGKHLNELRYKDFEDSARYRYFEYKASEGEDPKWESSLYKVEEGWTYDEMPFMHPKGILIGIPDRVIIKDGKIHIEEYKADKKIYMTAFRSSNKFAPKRKLMHPLGHIDDCSYMRYALQASLYMHLVWINNKNLTPGTIVLKHRVYDDDLNETERKDYSMHYMRNEVESLINQLKE